MDPLDRLGTLSTTTRCPSCERTTLAVVLRCDPGLRPCLVMARCESCASTYRIDPADTALDDAGDASVPCPRCGSTAHAVRLQCDLVSHVCTEILACPRCGWASDA